MIKTEYYKDLTKMNTFGMKVKARCFMEYDSVADLVDIEFEELVRPVLHIGGGSNLLFTDDFKGTVLHSKINFIEILDECQCANGTSSEDVDSSDSGPEDAPEVVLVSVGAGVVFDDFCDWAAKEGLWGVENLSYIPGEVGASAVQNIGAYGVEVKGMYIVTHVVFALSREPKPCLEYGHLKEAVAEAAGECQCIPETPSHSVGPSPYPGVGKCLLHTNGTSPESVIRFEAVTPALIRKVIIKIRKEKLPEPSVVGSAGSFFKNPVVSQEHFARIEAAAKAEHGPDYKVPHYDLPDGTVKIPAAWMIEQCGWKGKRSGGAAVWDKQPLVIVNYTGEAYPEEIIGLEKRIIASVKAKFGVDLHPEVEHI